MSFQVGPNSSETKSSLSDSHTNISPKSSSFSLSHANPPHSGYSVKVFIKPKFKIQRSADDISNIVASLRDPQVPSTSTQRLSPFYTKVRNGPVNVSEDIHTTTNVAYMDVNRLSKKNSKSLEKLESSSDSFLAQTARRKYRRHSLLDDSLGYVDFGVSHPSDAPMSEISDRVSA